MTENAKIDLIYDLVKEIDKKQDNQSERLAVLETISDRNANDLEKHIKRTDLLEESLEIEKKKVRAKFQEIEEPKKTAKNVGNFLKWTFGIITAVGGGIYAVVRLLNLK